MRPAVQLQPSTCAYRSLQSGVARLCCGADWELLLHPSKTKIAVRKGVSMIGNEGHLVPPQARTPLIGLLDADMVVSHTLLEQLTSDSGKGLKR